MGVLIDVQGPGMDCKCIGLFSRYSQIVRKWGYSEEDVKFEYRVDESRTDPLVFSVKDGIKGKIWERLPTLRELRDYLKREISKPVTSEPLTAGGYSSPPISGKVHPW